MSFFFLPTASLLLIGSGSAPALHIHVPFRVLARNVDGCIFGRYIYPVHGRQVSCAIRPDTNNVLTLVSLLSVLYVSPEAERVEGHDFRVLP